MSSLKINLRKCETISLGEWITIRIWTSITGYQVAKTYYRSLGESDGVESEECFSVYKNQFGFMPGRSTTKAIHLVRRLVKKYQERKSDLHVVFIDFEKAYDNSWREVIWRCLEAEVYQWLTLGR